MITATSPTVRIKVATATNTQLDYLAALCWYTDRRVELGVMGHMAFGVERSPGSGDSTTGWMRFDPTDDHAHAGPILAKLIEGGFELKAAIFSAKFQCVCVKDDVVIGGFGETHLVALVRAYVLSEMGDTVELPVELA